VILNKLPESGPCLLKHALTSKLPKENGASQITRYIDPIGCFVFEAYEFLAIGVRSILQFALAYPWHKSLLPDMHLEARYS